MNTFSLFELVIAVCVSVGLAGCFGVWIGMELANRRHLSQNFFVSEQVASDLWMALLRKQTDTHLTIPGDPLTPTERRLYNRLTVHFAESEGIKPSYSGVVTTTGNAVQWRSGFSGSAAPIEPPKTTPGFLRRAADSSG